MATAIVGVFTIKASNKVAASAKDQAVATVESVALGQATLNQERAALEASIRPVIVEYPLGIDVHKSEPRDWRQLRGFVDEGRIWIAVRDSAEADTVRVSVPVRNVGNGAAFVNRALITAGPGNVEDAECDHQVVPAGESATITATIKDFSTTKLAFRYALFSKQMLVSLRYSDVGDWQRTATVIRIGTDQPDTDGPFRQTPAEVQQIEMFYCDENWVRGKRFVGTGDITPLQ